MKYTNTYKHKLNAVKRQLKLYDEFLQEASLSFDDRMKIMQEITRLNRVKQQIGVLPITCLHNDCKDFNIKVNSSINESRTKTKLRYTSSRKQNCKQSL